MQLKEFNWGNGSFIIGYHLILLVGLPLLLMQRIPSLGVWISGFVLLYLSGLGITMGYHRFYAHKTYEPHKVVEPFLLLCGMLASEGSCIRWTHDHRLHHKHVDTTQDPYNRKNGFLYAHVLWILRRPQPLDTSIVPDLIKNKLTMFEYRHSVLLMFAVNIAATLVVALITGDLLGAFFISWLLRLFLMHHFTWFINSLAHTWGSQPFSNKHTAKDSYIVSIFTFGEGFHNFHHTFSGDYRNGIRWFDYDPGKWLIWLLGKLGLAKNIWRMDEFLIRYHIFLHQKEITIDSLRAHMHEKRDEWEQKIHAWSTEFQEKTDRARSLYYQYQLQRKERKAISIELKDEIARLRASLKEDWEHWKLLRMSITN